MKQTGLSGIAYVIGDVDLDVDALPNRRERLAAHDMPDMKQLWGWDRCRRSSGDALGLAAQSALRTLADTDPASIDALIVCSGERCNYFEQNHRIAALAQVLGLRQFQSHWLGGAGCVTLFAAVRLARSLVQTDAAQRVLVVTVDRVDDDSQRFQRFGVLSDGACSFVLHAQPQADFALLDAVVLSSSTTLSRSDDFKAKCDLIHAALERFGGAQGFDFERVGAFFGPNVFLPIQELELSLLPIDGALAQQDNTMRYGHCYAADPMINLVDYHAARAPHGGTDLLASTAHGHFGVLALQRQRR
jgi:3-oxoacyl-[acyl-carrier-protein] synthase-3